LNYSDGVFGVDEMNLSEIQKSHLKIMDGHGIIFE